MSHDYFLEPNIQSLQMLLLLCLYAWIRPSVLNVWRLLGHASRTFLDIIEAHGSDKTDAAYAGVLYRTLYTLETQIAISLGRPHQLPDGQELPEFSPDPESLAASELSTMRYNLARLQNRFHRDIISTGPTVSGQSHTDWAISNASWLSTSIGEIKAWIETWNGAVDLFVAGYPVPEADAGVLRGFLGSYGQLEQSEALLLAKIASGRRGQHLVAADEEVAACNQILQAVIDLHQPQQLSHHNILSPYPLQFIYPLTWTCAHAGVSAMVGLLQHGENEAGMQPRDLLLCPSLEVLDASGRNMGWNTKGLVHCIRSLYESRT
ncbi:hypothetical protein BJY04DRAFT_121630 [Aspergillus karnatakaensis]|uniref:uncharacterized protein n=1 Tax=Aspergillus karnatakaensis TaxID=1810916 RepID=UPI003CCE3A3F